MTRSPATPRPIRPSLTEAFAVFDPSFLERCVRERTGLEDPQKIAAWLEHADQDPIEAAAFHASLRISFTDFFRDPLAFAVIERVVLPRLGETRHGEIRAWSAGCATGPEAWSIAMLLEDFHRSGSGPSPYRVIATDVSEESLATAMAGVYPIDVAGNLRARHLRDYVTVRDDQAIIGDAIRARVSFSRLDLIDPRSQSPAESIYGGFDFVFCCNLLLYYRPEVRNLILGKLRRALSAGGYLVTGDAERGIVEKAGGFRAVAPPATVFQKET